MHRTAEPPGAEAAICCCIPVVSETHLTRFGPVWGLLSWLSFGNLQCFAVFRVTGRCMTQGMSKRHKHGAFAEQHAKGN